MNKAVRVERVVVSVSRLRGDALSGLIKKGFDKEHDLAAVLNSGLTVGLLSLG